MMRSAQFPHSRSPVPDPSSPGVQKITTPFPSPSGKAGLSAFPPLAEKERFLPVTGVDIQANKHNPGFTSSIEARLCEPRCGQPRLPYDQGQKAARQMFRVWRRPRQPRPSSPPCAWSPPRAAPGPASCTGPPNTAALPQPPFFHVLSFGRRRTALGAPTLASCRRMSPASGDSSSGAGAP